MTDASDRRRRRTNGISRVTAWAMLAAVLLLFAGWWVRPQRAMPLAAPRSQDVLPRSTASAQRAGAAVAVAPAVADPVNSHADADRVRVRTPDGLRATQARVWWSVAARDSVELTASGDDEDFVLPTGKREGVVAVRAPGFAWARIPIALDAEPRRVDVTLSPSARVEGRLRTASGRPVRGFALVWRQRDAVVLAGRGSRRPLADDEQLLVVPTTDSGSFVIDELDAGETAFMTASAEGFAPTHRSRRIVVGDLPIEIEMEPAVAACVLISEEDGAAFALDAAASRETSMGLLGTDGLRPVSAPHLVTAGWGGALPPSGMTSDGRMFLRFVFSLPPSVELPDRVMFHLRSPGFAEVRVPVTLQPLSAAIPTTPVTVRRLGSAADEGSVQIRLDLSALRPDLRDALQRATVPLGASASFTLIPAARSIGQASRVSRSLPSPLGSEVTLLRVPAATYALGFSSLRADLGLVVTPETIEVAAGATESVACRIERASAIDIVAYDADGKPYSGSLRVLVQRDAGRPGSRFEETLWFAAPPYLLPWLGAEEYHIRAFADDLASDETVVVTAAGEIVRVRLRLGRGAR